MYHRLVLLFLSMIFGVNIALASPTPPQVEAEAAIVMMANTNQVLFEKTSKCIMYPASTTKIMTLITALEKGNFNDIITVCSSDAACEGASLELKAGNQLTLKNALYGMMLISGNDAAEAIAENVAGSIPAFVEIMNAKAEEIGATSTHFTNPHGLPDPINHYTTAYDLGLITAYGMKNPDFAKIVSTQEYDVNFLNRSVIHVRNTNKLLNTYSGSNGVKTGYTNDAGDCVVASAKRGDIQLIAVILNSDYRWDDAAKLLDYGFEQVQLKRTK